MPRHLVVVGGCLMLAACGGGGNSTPTHTAPTGPSAPPPPQWALTGRVVATLSGEPLEGARITAGELTATTAADGRFELRRSTSPRSPLALVVERAGFLTRGTAASLPRQKDLLIDLIAERAPFDLSFYRALARDGLESTELEPLWPWTRDATFYLQTVDDTGRTLEPEVLAVLRQNIPAAFATWTHGQRRAVLQEGTADRAKAPGLVVVRFTRSREGSCATATIGGNDGWMRFNVDRCGCGSLKIDPETIWHEVGHIAGFWHVEGKHVMAPMFSGFCTPYAQLSAAEQHHSRIVYSRPYGNRDPDNDPASFWLVRPEAVKRPTVSCR
jgi:hypothetical protein